VRKNIVKNHTFFLFYVTLMTMSILIFSSCSDKENKDSNHIVQLTNPNTFILKTNDRSYNIGIEKKNISIASVFQPIILLNIFKPNCTSCLLHTQTLKSLEDDYNIAVINIAKSTQDKENINFVNEIYATLGITKDALNILSVLYINGTYYQHYEGLTPIEMVEHDIPSNNIK